MNNNANTESEIEKQSQFKNDGKKAVGILLYEFANGKGKDERSFEFTDNITQQMLSGNVPSDIKSDFLQVLLEKKLTFENFVLQGNSINGGYAFSPDHTDIKDSFNKHLNANWVQFFIGGANTKYFPSNESGWVIVEMSNYTSRNSLLIHKGENYLRDGSGINKPLSTIKQTFRFKLKIK